MRRRLFSIAALSLLLFVAVVVLWVRSYHVVEELRWRVEEGRATPERCPECGEATARKGGR